MDEMITRAREIADLCDSEFASDKELAAMSAEFYATYGCHWTEILNQEATMLIKLSKGRLKKLEEEYIVKKSTHPFPFTQAYNMVNKALKIVGKPELESFYTLFDKFIKSADSEKYELIHNWAGMVPELNKIYDEALRKKSSVTVTGKISSVTNERIYLEIAPYTEILAIMADRLKEKPRKILEKFGDDNPVKITGFLSGFENDSYYQNMIVADSVEKAE